MMSQPSQSACASSNSVRPSTWRVAEQLLIVATVIVLAACTGQPSQDSARSIVGNAVDNGDATRLRLVSFEKTDGRAMERRGVKAYELFFTAKFEFLSNATFTTVGNKITTSAFQESQGSNRSMKGDSLILNGTVRFESRDSGWVAVSLDYESTRDDSTRDMEAIRVAAERQAAEEAENRRLAEERAALLEKQRAEQDAKAERFVFTTEGPGEFRIGALTGNDVILIERLEGRYSKGTLWVATGGGSTGDTFYASDPLRIEMASTRRFHGGGDLDTKVEFEGTEGTNLKVRITVLCTQAANNRPCNERWK